MDRDLPSCTSIIDMSNTDDIGNVFENLVKRQTKFTKEFENNMEICSTQLKKLCVNNSSKTINLLNSLYNVDIKPSTLKKMQKKYELCSVCRTISHAPLQLEDKQPERLKKSSSQQSEDLLDTLLSMRRTKSRRFFFDFQHHPPDSSKPEVLKKEATTLFRDDRISDYFVFLINRRKPSSSKGFRKINLQTLKSLVLRAFDLVMNVFPLFNIKNFSNSIIVIQWVLFIIRVLFYRNIKGDNDIERESVIFGAFSGEILRDNLEVQRVLTSTFFHNSFAHLIISTMMHLRFLSVFEKINGIMATIFVYLLSSAYGMIGVCWIAPKTLQAGGFAGDWGVAGALLSRLFLFPYLLHREYQNITNVVVSYICLYFLKTIARGSSVLVSAHLLSGVCGLCMGTMINVRSKTNKILGIHRLLIDFICSFTLLVVPIFSIFMLYLVRIGN